MNSARPPVSFFDATVRSGASAAPLFAFEQTLYNGFLSGVSIKGDTFFYQNPLEATASSRNNTRSANGVWAKV